MNTPHYVYRAFDSYSLLLYIGKRSSFAPRAYLALLVKGWNYYARDKRVTALTISAATRVPDPMRWQR